MYDVLGHLAPVHRCARSMRCVACAESWATWLLFTAVPGRCVVLCVRYPGPLGSCSPVCLLGVLSCVCGVLGHLAPVHRCARMVCSVCSVCGVLGHSAPVHRCARSMRCVACAVSWATWLLFTGEPARSVALLVRCHGPIGSCSPVCLLCVLCCACGILGHLAPVHRCACSVCCLACAGPWATWHLFTRVRSWCVLSAPCAVSLATGLLYTGVPAQCVVLDCAVSWVTWRLFTGVPALCVELRVRYPGPLGSCSPVSPLGVLCCVCGVLGHLAPVHRCARSVCCVACAVSWATWLLFTGVRAWCVLCAPWAVSLATGLLFTGVPALCVVLRVRYPGPLGSCSPVCLLAVLSCVCGVLGHLAPVHRCARMVCSVCFVCGVLGHCAPVHRCVRSVCCVDCVVSWATWLLFTGVPALCVELLVQCHGPLGSCSPVSQLGVLCCVCGVLGHLAPVHRCVRSVCCVACAVSWATWLLFTGAHPRRVVLTLRRPGPLGSCSMVCPLGALCCVRVDLSHLAPVRRCARSLCCVGCAVCWATWRLFTGVHALFVVLSVRCPRPLGSRSPVCSLGVVCRLFGVLGHLAPVQRCARMVCSVCCVCGVLGHLAPVHRWARSGRCAACAVSSATWLLFTGVPARCVVLCVRCPGPLGSCSPVRTVGVLCCVCTVLGHLAPVHRCARSVRCVACAVSWATWLLFPGVLAR